jgi:hypothetical protein
MSHGARSTTIWPPRQGLKPRSSKQARTATWHRVGPAAFWDPVPSLLGRAGQAPGCRCGTRGTTVHLLLGPRGGPFTSHEVRDPSFHGAFRLREDPLARESTLGVSRARQKPSRRPLREESAPCLQDAPRWTTLQDRPCEEDEDGSRGARHGWRRSCPPLRKIRKSLTPPA